MKNALFFLILSSSLYAQEPVQISNGSKNELVCSPLIQNDVKPKCWQPPSQNSCWIMSSSAGIGYRRDRQKFVFKNTSIFQISQVNSLQGDLNLFFDFDHVLLRLNADYGWLINGICQAKLLPLSQRFTFPLVGGYTADAQGILECRVRFWNHKKGTASFVPGLGVNYSHCNFVPGGERIATYHPSPTVSGSTFYLFTKPFQQDWFGPIVEGKIELSFSQRWLINFFWQYIHVAFRQGFSTIQTNYLYDSSGVFLGGETIQSRILAKNNSMRTQLGGVDICYRSPHQWELGSHFEGSSTWIKLTHSRIRTKTWQITMPGSVSIETHNPHLSQFWVSYRINLYASYWF